MLIFVLKEAHYLLEEAYYVLEQAYYVLEQVCALKLKLKAYESREHAKAEGMPLEHMPVLEEKNSVTGGENAEIA